MPERMELGLPDKLELRDQGTGIEIVRKWFSWKVIFTTVFVVIWFGFLSMWFPMAFAFGNAFGGGLSLVTLIPLIHVAVGVGLAYTALTGWVNRTRITVDQGRISIRHGPLPWLGNKDLDGTTLKQLYSKEKISRGRNSTSVTYEVHALTTSGRNEKLLSSLETSEQALYIEQEIERYFRIEDAPVRGQIGD